MRHFNNFKIIILDEEDEEEIFIFEYIKMA